MAREDVQLLVGDATGWPDGVASGRPEVDTFWEYEELPGEVDRLAKKYQVARVLLSIATWDKKEARRRGISYAAREAITGDGEACQKEVEQFGDSYFHAKQDDGTLVKYSSSKTPGYMETCPACGKKHQVLWLSIPRPTYDASRRKYRLLLVCMAVEEVVVIKRLEGTYDHFFKMF